MCKTDGLAAVWLQHPCDGPSDQEFLCADVCCEYSSWIQRIWVINLFYLFILFCPDKRQLG